MLSASGAQQWVSSGVPGTPTQHPVTQQHVSKDTAILQVSDGSLHIKRIKYEVEMVIESLLYFAAVRPDDFCDL